jgi:hypothetical protein
MLRTHAKSYLGFPCKKCREPVIALSILAEMGTPTFGKSETIELECPRCHYLGIYDLGNITRYEEHQI